MASAASLPAYSAPAAHALIAHRPMVFCVALSQVNWRLLYDCACLDVELKAGDTMAGPGFTAALTATSPEGGAGDSHRGGVAAALVESLRVEAALNKDFSVAAQLAS